MKKTIYLIAGIATSCAKAALATAIVLGSSYMADAANNTAAPNKAASIFPQGLAEKVLNAPCDAGNENLLADTVSGKSYVSKAYYQVKSTQPLAPQAGLLIKHAATAAEADSQFTMQKQAQQAVDVNIQGATKAYRTQKPGQLNILKGCNILIITAGTVKQPDAYGQEKIAKEVLPKLVD